MASKEFLEEVNGYIKDILATNFSINVKETNKVPSYEDGDLSYERNRAKNGKRIKTCVLYVDIRSSVALNNKHQDTTMGKLYTAFVKSVLLIVDYHNGVVRNIIGDRVMAVFPPKGCYTNAVDCAISIHTVMTRMIDKHFKLNDFKCGIGIDYGSMLVLKNGIIKQGIDRTSYKNLVWIGRPANIASRLTDLANKEINTIQFDVHYNPYNWRKFSLGLGFSDVANYLSGMPPRRKKIDEPIYQNWIAIDKISEKEFTEKISWSDYSGMNYSGGKFIKFEKKINKTKPDPILMTEEVYEGLKSENSLYDSIKKKFWNENKLDVKDYKGIVYGGNIVWASIDKMKL